MSNDNNNNNNKKRRNDASFLRKISIPKVKYNLLKMAKYNFLEQKILVVTNFIRLTEKLFLHMQVRNMLSHLFFMNNIFF